MTPLKLVPLGGLPWMRRERADSHLRRALGELEALQLEDARWATQYESLAEGVECALSLLNLVEDAATALAAAPTSYRVSDRDALRAADAWDLKRGSR